MNIAEHAKTFVPGQPITMKADDFTPELQEDIVNAYFGERKEPPAPAVPPGHVALPEDAARTLDNFQKVFSFPGVAEAINGVINGQPAGTYRQAPASTNQPPAPQPQNNQQAPAPQPQPPADNPNNNQPAEPANDNPFWWENDNATQPPSDTTATHDNPQPNPNAGQGQQQPQQQQPQQQDSGVNYEEAVSSFNNELAAAAIRRGVSPQEVMDLYGTMSPDDMVELALAIQQSAVGAGAQNAAPAAQPRHETPSITDAPRPSTEPKVTGNRDVFGNAPVDAFMV